MSTLAKASAPPQKRRKKGFNSEVFSYNLLMIPGVILLLIFAVIPMVGIIIAFQDFVPAKGIFGSEWIGFENFKLLFVLPDSMEILFNTMELAIAKMAVGTIVPIAFALMLNEVRNGLYKRLVQTSVYLPYFLSWVLLGSIFISMLSLDGVVNSIVKWFGGDPVMFMASNKWAPAIMVITDCWKNFGYGSIIYLAALSGVDVNLYEAAALDGANRMKQIRHVTLPALVPTIVLVSTLNLGNVLNAGFDQIFNMYNPMIYESVDIIDTFVYRLGLVEMQFGLSTAVGLFKSAVSLVLIVTSYALARKWTGYRIF